MHVITSMGPAAVELERNFQLRLRQAARALQQRWRSRLPPFPCKLSSSLSYLLYLPTNPQTTRFPPPFFSVRGVYIAGQSGPGLGSVSPETSYSEQGGVFLLLILSSSFHIIQTIFHRLVVAHFFISFDLSRRQTFYTKRRPERRR